MVTGPSTVQTSLTSQIKLNQLNCTMNAAFARFFSAVSWSADQTFWQMWHLRKNAHTICWCSYVSCKKAQVTPTRWRRRLTQKWRFLPLKCSEAPPLCQQQLSGRADPRISRERPSVFLSRVILNHSVRHCWLRNAVRPPHPGTSTFG